jgi:competence protein ComEC
MWPAVIRIMPATGRVLYIRSWMIGLLLGAVVATRLPWLLPVGITLLALPLLGLFSNKRAAVFVLGLVLGCVMVSLRGQGVLHSQLRDECTGAQFEVEGTVVSLPRISQLDAKRRRQRFEFELEGLSPEQCRGPRKILLSWYGQADILPGQRWRFQARLRRPWGLANEGSFNMQAWYVLTGIDAVGSAREQQARLLVQSNGQQLNRWRQAISRAIADQVSGLQASAVLRAVTVADKSGIDHQLWNLFQRLGINHLLVISGLHIGMVAALSFGLGRALAACLRVAGASGRYWAELLTIGMALLYTGLAGFSVATQRALFMLLCFILAAAFNRTTSGGDKLLIAAVLVVTINPLAPMGSGFWLSFSAVAALLWLAHWQRLRSKPATLLVAHVYMGLLMLPLGAFWFGGSSWLSAPANLLLVPLVGFYVVPLALGGVLLFALGLPAYALLWRLAAAPLELLFDYVPSALGGGGLLAIQAASVTAILALLALALLVTPGNTRRKLLLAVLCLPLLLPARQSPLAPVLNVLDVGQGTAVVFRAGGRVLLYDTGGGNPAGANLAQSVVLPFLRSQGAAAIDSLVISHGDLDHSAGVHAILAALPVADTWVGGGLEGIPGARPCRAGMAWQWGRQAKFQFLSPAPVQGQSDNDASCVLAIDIGQKRLLLAGDIEERQERQLVGYWQDNLASDLLLVGHHGSKTSTSQSWLNRVKPQLAIINNAYGNHFGHPAAEVVQRLHQQQVRVLHTARSGALEITLDEAGQWQITGQREGIKPWWM